MELAEELYKSVDATDPDFEAEWAAEIRKRIETIRAGQVEGIPALDD